MEKTDIKIAIESMTFCQGNCQGCFFSEVERTSGEFLSKEKLEKIGFFIKNYTHEISELDMTLIFGQGDHLSLKTDEIENLFFSLKQLTFLDPLVILTTSAIGKTTEIKEKVNLIKKLSIEFNLRVFMSVVIDPKKMLHANFKERYFSNIQYIRESFGFIDLAINLGKDTLEYISPEQFADFLEENKFRHVELNLIPTINTVQKFSKDWNSIISWLLKFQQISKNKKYLTFHRYKNLSRANNLREIELLQTQILLENELGHHLYISHDLNLAMMLSGFTGNAIPYNKKTGYEPVISIENYSDEILEKAAQVKSLKILKNIVRNPTCTNCKYNKICAFSGVDVFRDKVYSEIHQEGCFLNIKDIFKDILLDSGYDMGVDASLIPKYLKGNERAFPLDEDTQISGESLKA